MFVLVPYLMIDRERINSLFSLSHEKVIASCVDPEGGRSMITVEMIAIEAITVEMITVEVIVSCVDPGGGGRINNQHRINSQLLQFFMYYSKDFTYFFSMSVLITLGIHNNAQVSLQNCILTCPLCFSPNKFQSSQIMCKHWAPEGQWCCKKHYP